MGVYESVEFYSGLCVTWTRPSVSLGHGGACRIDTVGDAMGAGARQGARDAGEGREGRGGGWGTCSTPSTPTTRARARSYSSATVAPRRYVQQVASRRYVARRAGARAGWRDTVARLHSALCQRSACLTCRVCIRLHTFAYGGYANAGRWRDAGAMLTAGAGRR